MYNKIQFTRINSDLYGNPRYVCHFSNLVNDNDRIEAQQHGIGYISELYRIAVKRANKLGGRKYHTKSFGGGIVFQSYNTNQLEIYINEALGVNVGGAK